MGRRQQGSGSQSARWILGTLLFVQGFGSAVTQTLWDTAFGVAGLARASGLPEWTDLLLGAAGAVLLLWALARHHANGREQTDG
ncbi:hypothetical protein [Actinomadura rifamycini]|uniref:hypothetical protein n=1 Tax=Actinomadura rifamycini TaxID=31962 RepID=UPI0004271D82|nr:hypothetical protein [Actinomadura rifamycini]